MTFGAGLPDQRATTGRLTMASSLKGAMVSRVMYRSRWTVSTRLPPPSRVERCFVDDVVIGVVTDVVSVGGYRAGWCGVGNGAPTALDG